MPFRNFVRFQRPLIDASHSTALSGHFLRGGFSFGSAALNQAARILPPQTSSKKIRPTMEAKGLVAVRGT
jgi:hypothetical protein